MTGQNNHKQDRYKINNHNGKSNKKATSEYGDTWVRPT